MKDVVIIMIMPYAPFGLGRMVETVKRDPEVGGMRIQIVDELIKRGEENAELTEKNARVEKKEKA